MHVLQVSAGSEQELQEIRAIEQAGHRRRRRWLNEKVRQHKKGSHNGNSYPHRISVRRNREQRWSGSRLFVHAPPLYSCDGQL
jgi:hypothetical protein